MTIFQLKDPPEIFCTRTKLKWLEQELVCPEITKKQGETLKTWEMARVEVKYLTDNLPSCVAIVLRTFEKEPE